MSYEVEIVETVKLGGKALDTKPIDTTRVKALQDSAERELPEALIITIDSSHCGYVNANRFFYTHKGMTDSVKSMVSPYYKPMLTEHEKKGKPLGRVITSDFMEMKPENGDTVQITQNGEVVGTIKVSDLCTEDESQFPTDVLIGSRKPSGFMRNRVRITDKAAIKSILDGEFYTVSISGAGQGVKCSIPWCGKDIGKDGLCEHERGKIYENEDSGRKAEAYWIVDGVDYKELSFVNVPSDSFAGIRKIEVIFNGERSEVDPKVIQMQNSLEDSCVTAAVRYFYQIGESIVEIPLSDAREKSMADKKEKTPLALADLVSMSDEEVSKAIEDKAVEEATIEDAKLTAAARNKLPDSAFCYVKDVDGKKVRKFPAHDAAHVRNGLARLSQSDLSDAEKAQVKACLVRKGKKLGVKASEDGTVVAFELAEATMEDIKDLEIFESWQKDNTPEDIKTLVGALTDSKKSKETLQAEVEELKKALSDKEAEISRLTEDNSNLNSRIHLDLATRVADSKIKAKVGKGKKYWELEESARSAHRDEMIKELQKKSTEYLLDSAEDLKDEDLEEDHTTPQPSETVDNPGNSVADSQQTPAGQLATGKKSSEPETKDSRMRRIFRLGDKN